MEGGRRVLCNNAGPNLLLLGSGEPCSRVELEEDNVSVLHCVVLALLPASDNIPVLSHLFAGRKKDEKKEKEKDGRKMVKEM